MTETKRLANLKMGKGMFENRRTTTDHCLRNKKHEQFTLYHINTYYASLTLYRTVLTKLSKTT